MSRPRRVTLQDIADQLGITKMTVSRYLRAPDSVALKTREKIARAIEELGYIHSRVPGILSKAASKTVGIVIPSLSNQVFADLIKGIENVTEAAGYSTLIVHTGYDPLCEEEKVSLLLSYQVDALVLTQTNHTAKTRRRLSRAGVPVVEAMELPQEPLDMAVGLDHTQAAFDVVSSMINKGKRQIIYMAARMDPRTLLRQQGYEQAMARAHLTPVVIASDAHSSFTLGAVLMEQALSEYSHTDGVLCTNDDLAVGAMLYCQRINRDIPRDISIVGYNALNIGLAMEPKLTSVITPRQAMGEKCAQLLLARLCDEEPVETFIDMGYSLSAGGTL